MREPAEDPLPLPSQETAHRPQMRPTCSHLVNMKGTRCPKCSASELGPYKHTNMRTVRQH
jgi:hypothetical protein